ncbi:MAG: hypothetical protein H6Q89_5158, partial [Myxococcaceae bacterium]|nr:hypothetical protein [Myxococcaceae bacterium]
VLVALALVACKQRGAAEPTLRIDLEPNERVCNQMQALCNVARPECERSRLSMRANYGDAALKAYDACYLRETSCYGASGCMTEGAAANGFVNLLEKPK